MKIPLFLNNQFYKEVDIEIKFRAYKELIIMGENSYDVRLCKKMLEFVLESFYSKTSHSDFILGICMDKGVYFDLQKRVKENRRKKERRGS